MIPRRRPRWGKTPARAGQDAAVRWTRFLRLDAGGKRPVRDVRPAASRGGAALHFSSAGTDEAHFRASSTFENPASLEALRERECREGVREKRAPLHNDILLPLVFCAAVLSKLSRYTSGRISEISTCQKRLVKLVWQPKCDSFRRLKVRQVGGVTRRFLAPSMGER